MLINKLRLKAAIVGAKLILGGFAFTKYDNNTKKYRDKRVTVNATVVGSIHAQGNELFTFPHSGWVPPDNISHLEN